MKQNAHYLGIDLGTSSLKVLLLSHDHRIVAQADSALTVQHPKALHAEQSPDDWWYALDQAMNELQASQPQAMKCVRAIGLSGQMHGVVLLDEKNKVLRPAILWNDGRSTEQCEALFERVPELRSITGNIAMAGFSAPKLLWIKQHEPSVFEKTNKILLPKDYLRWLLSEQFVSDMSDAAGTLWLDVKERSWSASMLQACELTEQHMPRLCEGSDVSAGLLPTLAKRWGLDTSREIRIAGGAGDNAASAVGLGVMSLGQGFISLGTSGVVFVAAEQTNNALELPSNQTVHTFCHALPQRWHYMSVMLSCAASVDWASKTLRYKDTVDLLMAANSVYEDSKKRDQAPLFLPYLSGERSPHNNAHAAGVWFGLKPQHDSQDLAYAVAEGVCFGLCDGYLSLPPASRPAELAAVGGLSQSGMFLQLLADVCNVTLTQVDGGRAGAALGAARLGYLADEGDIETVCTSPTQLAKFLPNQSTNQTLQARYSRFKALYLALEPHF